MKTSIELTRFLADRVSMHLKYPEEFKDEMIERRLKLFNNQDNPEKGPGDSRYPGPALNDGGTDNERKKATDG